MQGGGTIDDSKALSVLDTVEAAVEVAHSFCELWQREGRGSKQYSGGGVTGT